ncbi:DUF3883 domain-containing protein [Candidatus Saccharibacteria bacterium]|nr:DUF3883 domain-containing protein [Candidatus Saccharibacteria bacterium]
MNRENKELIKLLSLDNLYSLYRKIGDSINNDIDLHNSGYDPISRDNSITVLEKCELIAERDELFSKAKQLSSIDGFSKELLKMIRIIYSDEIRMVLSLDKKYDENRNLFYISRNKVDLNYSGLIMLLSDLSFIQVMPNRIYLFDEGLLKEVSSNHGPSDSRRIIGLIELENELALRKIHGEIGERKAYEYEIKILSERGILKTPKIISDIDVSAGYDLVSYLSPESTCFDKFIEVKSCYDKKQAFYLSSNELRIAKEKGESYYLYIYIRESDEIILINNPYEKIFLSEEWAKEPQVYKVHRIIDGDII